ncbi:MAG: penicillin acylase family protein [Promethearchaeota archaeon]
MVNLLASGFFALNLYKNSQFDDRFETIQAGTTNVVSVYRDADGVPIINASTLEDLFFAQGYIEARDRLFQCDLIRKLSSGKLASILGDDFLESDILIQSIGIPAMADASVAKTKPEILHLCQSFVDGMNLYVARIGNDLPMDYEFLKLIGNPLGYTPDPFTVQDILHVLLYLSFELNSNLGFNVGIKQLAEKIGLEAFEQFSIYLKAGGEYNITQEDLDGYNSYQKHRMPPYSSTFEAATTTLLTGKISGSNCWVVSGNKTESGFPLLANDPHLNAGNPGIMKSWYLECQPRNFKLVGSQFPLIPGIFLGRNANISWGVTAPFHDFGDAWKETFDETGDNYLYNGSYHPVVKDVVEIPLQRGGTYLHEVKRIPGHGVLLEVAGEVVSFRWAAMLDQRPLNNGSNYLNGLFGLFFANTSSDVAIVSDPATGYDDFPMCIQFSTKEGDIGYYAMGRLPIRKNERLQGAIPLNGSDPGDDWERWCNQSEIPRAINPDSGFLYAANTRIDYELDNEKSIYIAPAFGNAYRANRIRDLLEAGNNFTFKDMQDIQGDLLDYWAPDHVPAILSALDLNESHASVYHDARDALASWDFRYTKNSVGSTIYYEFMERYGYAILGDELNVSRETIDSDDFSRLCHHILTPEILLNLTLDYNTSSIVRSFFDDNSTTRNESLGDIVLEAFIRAVDSLRTMMGGVVESWRWSTYNPLVFKHLFYQGQSYLEFLNIGTFAADGGSCVRMQRHGDSAVTRFITELKAVPVTSMVSPPGPIGNFFSQFKDSEVEVYLENGLKYFSDDLDTLLSDGNCVVSTLFT